MEVRTPVRPSFLKRLVAVFLSFAMVLCYFVVVPVQEAKAESAEKTVKAVSLGYSHSAAITNDGSLWTWGHNGCGQLGDGTTTDRTTPVKVMENVRSVSLGHYSSAAITNDGSLWTWGHNAFGQLGQGTRVVALSPVKIMEGVLAVSMSHNHGAAITNDGSLWTWGNNTTGQLGTGEQHRSYNTPVKIMDNTIAVSVGSNQTTDGFSAAITNDSSLWVWGASGIYHNGWGSCTTKPRQFMHDVVAISMKYQHFAAIKSNGSLCTWGSNACGELGDGTTEYSYKPKEIMKEVVSASLGYFYSAAITANDSLWLWGRNDQGQLGDGTTIQRHTPVFVFDNVESVSLGFDHSAAIRTDGSLWTWGNNDDGQLGDGTTTDRSVPVKLTFPDDTSGGVTSDPQLPSNLSGEFDLALQATQKNGKATISCKWDDGWFSKPSGAKTYNHDLATTASVLSSAVYKEKYIEEDLEKLGFDNSKYGYVSYYPNNKSDYNGDYDQVGYEIAAKDIAVDGKAVQLLLVAVRGTPGNMEWDSNANVADSTPLLAPAQHEGFKDAQELVLAAVNAYAYRHNIDLSTARVLVTGHSRGAAVANLLGKSLDDGRLSNKSGTVAAERAYVFTFACPNVTKSLSDMGKNYPNIYNIVNPEDIVTRVPLGQWGYYRYGVSYVLPSKSNTSTAQYKALKTSMNTVFNDLCGKNYESYASGTITARRIARNVACDSPTAEAYQIRLRPELTLLLGGLYDEPLDTVKVIAGASALLNFNRDLACYLIKTLALDFLIDELGLPNNTANLVGNGVSHGHTQETYIAWMKSSDASIFEGHSYRGVNISCPVDVKVYDSNNNLVCSIVNDVVDAEVMENGLAADVQNGTKSIDVPDGEQYRFEITATDNGTMDISCTSYEAEGAITEQIGFDNLPLEVGKTYTMLSEESDSEQPSQGLGDLVALSSPEGMAISSNYSATGDEVGGLTINVTVEGEGVVAYPRTATRGDRVTLQAAPAEGYAFDGWYSAEGAKLSSEASYTFRCDTSSNFTAVFTHTHTWDSGVVTTEPTYTSDGVKTYTCTGCNATKTEPISKLNPPSFGGGGGSSAAGPGTAPSPVPTPDPEPEPEPEPNPVEPERMDAGTTFEVGGIAYTVLADGKTVSIMAGSVNFDGKTLRIPAVVKDANGFEYKVTEVAANAFKNCTSIKKLVISEGITAMGAYAFKGCTKLESVTLPKSLTTIERSVFSGCKKLTKLTIPAKVKEIGKYAFYNSGIKTLTIKSAKLTKDGLSAKALAGSSIKIVKVPENKLKAYKKLFTKSGCGKAVTLREL